MKRMLINATQPEELRVALVDGQSIYDFDMEQIGQERKRANIYKGRVSRAEQSLGAAFIDFGSEKHGFLSVKELAPQYQKNKNGKNIINECLSQGQEIIVQVEKEERGTKGAALSTFISLPGHYLVLMPNSPEAGGISKSIEGESRDDMRKKMRSLEVPEGMGVILRTAGEGVSLEELQWDLDYLLNLWDAIQEANQLRKAPFLIYRENDLVSRSLRDFLRSDITEVLVDTDEAFEKAHDFTSKLMPDFEDRIKRYDEATPLFTRYQIESQIETAYQREVTLPSGGSIVIDQTEALVAIDINSKKSTKGSDIEETALNTNLEAAVEISKQLRLRDMGGLIVIDFIDMLSLKNKRAIEDKLWSSLSIDRAKTQVGRISRFGLMEMSRQRLRPSLQERWTQDVASLSTAVLRLIEEEAGKKSSGEVRAVVSPDMSIFLLNERRPRVNEIEERTGVRIVVVSDPTRSDNRFEVTRLKDDDKKLKDSASYEIQDEVGNSAPEATNPLRKTRQETPAVNIKPPKKPRRKKEGFLKKFINSFTKKEKEEPKPKPNSRRNTRRNNQNRPQQGAPRKNTSNQARRNPNAKPKASEENKPNNKSELSKKKPANNRSDSRERTQSDKRNNQKDSDNDKKVNPAKANGNTNEKPKSTKPKPRPRRTPPKENVEKNGNVIPEEKIITEIDGNVDSGKPVRSSRKKDSSSDNETKRRTQKSSTASKVEKKSDVEETPVKEKPVKEPKQEKTSKEKVVKEDKQEETAVKEPKQEESSVVEEPAKKAKDWGRASNDPRNK
jgi:ribonuclease E